MKRRRVALLALIALAGGSAAAWPYWGPPLGRKIDWFAAERVEVAGSRLVPPGEVMAASGVRVGTNIWTDPAPFVSALRRHPAVAGAEVTRVWPRALRIRIVEKTPAALVQAGVLRPATADGEVLEVDAARAGLDLPLFTARVRMDGRRIADADARATLAETARLAAIEPALMARVSEVRPLSATETRLILARPAADVLVRDGIGAAALVRLRAALDDAAARMAADTTAHARLVVDARFDDQVVVRRKI